MKYKFIRYKYTEESFKNENVEKVSSWLFEPSSKDQIYEFFYKFTMLQKNSADERMITNIQNALELNHASTQFRIYRGHPDNNWDASHWNYLYARAGKEQNVLTINSDMAQDMLKSRLALFENGIRHFYDAEGYNC